MLLASDARFIVLPHCKTSNAGLRSSEPMGNYRDQDQGLLEKQDLIDANEDLQGVSAVNFPRT